MQEIKIRLGDAQFTIYPENGSFCGSNEWGQSAHFHAYYEIHVIKSGSASLVVKEDHVHLTEGDVCLFAPNVSHYVEDYSADLVRCSFMFNPAKISVDAKNKNFSFSEYKFYTEILRNFGDYFIIKDYDKINTFSRLKDYEFSDENIHRIKAILSLFLVDFCEAVLIAGNLKKDSQNGRDVETDYMVKQKIVVEKFFYERYNERISIEDLADKLCLSVCQTNRIVKKFFGMSFKKLLVKQRVENACMLIKQGKLSLDEISRLSGYSSYNGFFYAFKSFLGKTPEEYKLEKKN